MAFRVPSFPLVVHVWHGGGVGGAYAAPDLLLPANLSPGRRVMIQAPLVAGPGTAPIMMELLVPARSDVRASWNGGVSDLIECPAGTLRFYLVSWVDDVGRGFPNEYRIVGMYYSLLGNTTLAGGPFPAPVPLN
jgi:hypothetical protein